MLQVGFQNASRLLLGPKSFAASETWRRPCLPGCSSFSHISKIHVIPLLIPKAGLGGFNNIKTYSQVLNSFHYVLGTTNKNSRDFDHFWVVATFFLCFQRNFLKKQRKICHRTSILIEAEWSNWLTVSTIFIGVFENTNNDHHWRHKGLWLHGYLMP
jgi:hypothetical protein